MPSRRPETLLRLILREAATLRDLEAAPPPGECLLVEKAPARRRYIAAVSAILGEVPPGMQVVQFCGDPWCVAHLGFGVRPAKRRELIPTGIQIQRSRRRLADLLVRAGLRSISEIDPSTVSVDEKDTRIDSDGIH